MARADSQHITNPSTRRALARGRLSSMIVDPFVKDAFEAVECDREGDPGCDDREDVCEDEGSEHGGREPDVDGEPILGAFDRVVNQEKSWLDVNAGQADELDDCDLEDTGDDEPSIGDAEGLLEQTGNGGGIGATGFTVAVE